MRGNLLKASAIMGIMALSAPPEPFAATPEVCVIADSLEQAGRWGASADYRVWLPQNTDEVCYEVDLLQFPPSGSSQWLGADYLIEWRYLSAPEPERGFSAYFDGNHYRYAGRGMMNEYHTAWDTIPFRPAARPAASVQRSAMFASLLPAVMAQELRELASDTLWTLSFSADSVLTAERRHDGETVARRRYFFSSDSLRPRRLTVENNIGQLSEQTIEVRYLPLPDSLRAIAEVDEALIAGRWPQVFERFRESNFSIESLEDQSLPGFSLPTLTGERYSRQDGDDFRSSTVVALIDPAALLAPRTIEALRYAAEVSPVPIDLVLAFLSSDIDEVEELTGEARMGEAVLLGGRRLARDFGAAVFPAFLVCSADGKVRRVITGYDPDLPSLIIQSLM